MVNECYSAILPKLIAQFSPDLSALCILHIAKHILVGFFWLAVINVTGWIVCYQLDDSDVMVVSAELEIWEIWGG